MPVTPLHFGPALLVREIVGPRAFGLWSFTATQVLFDIEPVVRIIFDLPGALHETTHNPTVGAIYALLAMFIFWPKDRWGVFMGAWFGVVSHLWLDAIYHADVAANIARWGYYEIQNGPYDAVLICFASFALWLFVRVCRVAIQQYAPEPASRGLAGTLHRCVDYVWRVR